MADPLADIVAMLKPGALQTKVASGAGQWMVRRPPTGQPFYCVVVEGRARLAADGASPIELQAGDFVLIPATQGFEMSGADGGAPEGGALAVTRWPGETRHGDPGAPPTARLLIGQFSFGSPDALLLVSLLPKLLHVRGESRLTRLVQLVGEEAVAERPGREPVLERLLEVLLIEALRSGAGAAAHAGLLQGLADARVSAAIRAVHQAPAEGWTVPRLAREAGMSRSAFFERFSRAVGLPPMSYVAAWRMALAKQMLERGGASISEVAQAIGYGSASAFTVAFSRSVGRTPAQFARGGDERNALSLHG